MAEIPKRPAAGGRARSEGGLGGGSRDMGPVGNFELGREASVKHRLDAEIVDWISRLGAAGVGHVAAHFEREPTAGGDDGHR